jgi:CIC family chloride channel protein
MLSRVVQLARRGISPLQLGMLGRTLLHSALVGAAAGVAGCLFFWTLEMVQWLVLESLAGYVSLRAAGEQIVAEPQHTRFRPWLLAVLPAIGALVAGIISVRAAPETRGGGADAIIHAFHHQNGHVRRRVPVVKALASVFTLGFGGSGGREGPIMQIGGAIGAIVARYLRVNARERRILMVAGLAAGVSAVFRTPLGAALLAVEVLHRDDFESDALVPSVLASVVAYSVFISVFGEATLFAHAPRYPFVPAHLPLYGLMAVGVCFVATVFLSVLNRTRKAFAKASLPEWCKPAIGGLMLGATTVPVLLVIGPVIGGTGNGVGILGGGYGAAQLAITGAPWLANGWLGVQLLLVLGSVKILATALTIGSGGSAGDFGPSLVIGAIFGGAFGRAAEILLNDPRIDPGAFALVGMATFYGGLAHCPLAALVLVCELAGSYDLLVPLMLAEGVAFVALRHKSLYGAQVASRRESPAHRDDLIFDVLRGLRIDGVVITGRPFVTFHRTTPASEVIRKVGSTEWQDIFPVLDDAGKLVGVISSEVLRTLANSPDLAAFALADDMMGIPVSVRADEDLHVALEALLHHGVRELVVVDAEGKIVGILDEAEITRVYHDTTSIAVPPASGR